MKKRLFTIICLCFSIATIGADKVDLVVELGNGQKLTIVADDATDKIYNFKVDFYLSKKGKLILQKYHTSFITRILHIEKLPILKKLELIYSLNGATNLDFISSSSLETLFISTGISLNDTAFMKNIPNLKILGLNYLSLNTEELDLTRTSLEYLELSDVTSKPIPKIKIPATMQVINLMGSVKEADDLNFIVLPKGKTIVRNIMDSDPSTVAVIYNYDLLYGAHEELIMNRPY